MKKAVFLDRDGTINVDKNYLYKPKDFELLPGVIEGLRMLQIAGYLLIVITNQSGIGRGYYTEEELKALNKHMIRMFEKQDVYITDVFYCPHLPDAKIEKYRLECDCRKPKLGMFYEAIEKWDIDLDKSWAIGDRERDCAICENTGCRGIIVQSQKEHNQKIYQSAGNLVEAAQLILKSET